METVRGWRAQDVSPQQIGVAARTTAWARAAAETLAAQAFRRCCSATATPGDDEVAVATMHRMKGLEFRRVAVVGVSAAQVPLPAAITAAAEDPVAHALDLQRERCLLFVACNRARERLAVSWHGDPDPFLLEIGTPCEASSPSPP